MRIFGLSLENPANQSHHSAVYPNMSSTIRSLIVIGLLALSSGCATYTTPGGPADFRALGITADEQDNLTDYNIAQELARKPAASFPAGVAVVRVQADGYRSHSYSNAWNAGRFSIMSERDAEDQIDIDRFASLPMLRGLVRMNRLVIENRIESEEDLRKAAARVQADMLLLYTFDTRFDIETTVPFLGTFSLGILPNKAADVTATVSAALIDTRTGYVYALVETSDTQRQIANAWTSQDAVDQSRTRAERNAFSKLVDEFESAWGTLVRSHSPDSLGSVSGAD